jgi:choline dehydrogenase
MSSVSYDTVIIGAGAAGCVLAARLSENPFRRIALIEAGPDFPNIESLPSYIRLGSEVWHQQRDPEIHTWRYWASARPDRTIQLPRGKLVGGSTAINGQVFLRGIPDDFGEWVALGNQLWEFTSVLPYFKKLETDLDFPTDDFHGNFGPMPVRRSLEQLDPLQQALFEAALDAGFSKTGDMNHPDSTGVGIYPKNRIADVRMSTAITYLALARHRTNLTIVSDTLVERILFEKDRASGIQVVRNGRRSALYSSEIVLAAGAINSPKILLLSGLGATDELYDLGVSPIVDLPGVGCGLQDHPAVDILCSPKRGNLEVHDAQVCLRTNAPTSIYRNDVQVRVMRNRAKGRSPSASFGLNVALEKTFSTGRVRVTSKDAGIAPDIHIGYLDHPSDLVRMREALRLACELGHSQRISSLIIPVSPTPMQINSDSLLERWLRENAGTQHHVSGTCKIGPPSDRKAVVDQHCQVYGVRGLRVVDASIMPVLVRANTTATTIMIAERVADWMA